MLKVEIILDGWHRHGLLLAAGEMHEHPMANKSDAVKEHVLNVKLGNTPPDTLIVSAVRESEGGGYPPLLVCVPFDPQTIADWLKGDPSAMGDVKDALEDAAEGYLAQVKRGKVN